MKNKILTRLFIGVLVVSSIFMLSACTLQKDVNIASIEVIEDTVPTSIEAEKFDEAGIKLLVTYEDLSTQEIPVTTDLIPEEYHDDLNRPGIYEINILFKGKETKLRFTIVERTYDVNFYTPTGVLIETQKVKKGMDATAPVDFDLSEDYDFVGWDRTFENISEDTNVYGISAKFSIIRYLPNAPTFSRGWEALNYAYNIKANYSYSSNFKQINVNDPDEDIVIKQSVIQRRYKTDNETLILATAHCDNSEGVNFSSYTYTNEAKNKVETRVCYNSDWNFTNEQVKTYTISDFKAERGQTLNDPYFQLSSKNATLDSFKIAGANYVLKLTLKSNVEGVFDDMIKSIENGEAPGIKDAKGISATFEITINRKTGAFVEIKSTERYSVCKLTNSFGWQSSTITANNTETFNFADINIDKLVASTIA